MKLFALRFALGMMLLIPATVSAASLDSLFAYCPERVLPLLTTNDRLDLLDYYAAHLPARITNRYGGTSTLAERTDSCLTLNLTEVSTWQMLLLPRDEVLVVHTYKAATALSTVHRYSSDWRELNLLLPPRAEDLCPLPDTLSPFRQQELACLLNLCAIEATIDPCGRVLTWQLSLTALTEEQRTELTPYLCLISCGLE